MLFGRKIFDQSNQASGGKEGKDTSFQDLLLQLTYGQPTTPISLLKRLKGNPLYSDLLASLKHSPFTRDNFAEIDLSRFDSGYSESPLNRRLVKVPSELMSPASVGRRTELSLHSRKDTNSESDIEDCISTTE